MPRNRLFSLAWYVILSATGISLALAQEPADPRLEWQIRALGFRFENFFQAPAGEPEQDVETFRTEGKVAFRLRPDRPLAVYGQAGFTGYGDGLDDSTRIGLGLESEARGREWAAGLERIRDQPVFEVGDEFDRADVLRAAVRSAHRITDDWELTGLAEWRRQEFDLTAQKDNDFYSGGGAIRYRGWGYGFSPEIGVELGRRDAEDPNEDHDQQDVWLKIRSVPTPPLYLSLRYRHRTRDYSIDDPLASNFDREDERDDWTLNGRYRLTEWAALDLYYKYLDADSDKESRIFSTHTLGLGVTVGRF